MSITIDLVDRLATITTDPPATSIGAPTYTPGAEGEIFSSYEQLDVDDIDGISYSGIQDNYAPPYPTIITVPPTAGSHTLNVSLYSRVYTSFNAGSPEEPDYQWDFGVPNTETENIQYTLSDTLPPMTLSWTRQNMPAGVQLRDIAIDEVDASTILALPVDGFPPRLSVDGGGSWSTLSSLPSDVVWTCGVVAGNTLLAKPQSGGVIWKSTDKGLNWSQTTPTALANGGYWIPGSIVSSTNGAYIYGFTAGAGGGNCLVKSTDLGTSWVRDISMGTKNWRAISCTADGSRVVAAVEDGLYVSTNYGSTWSFVSTPNKIWYSISIANSSGSTLFGSAELPSMRTAGWLIYKSVDSGATWSECTHAGRAEWLLVRAVGEKVFAAAYGSAYVSGDSGTSWQDYNFGESIRGISSGHWTANGSKLVSSAYLGSTDAVLIAPCNTALTPSSVTTSGLTLGWTKATDDTTAQSGLQYRVYKSLSNNISSVEEILANGTAVGDYAADINTKAITGLSSNQTYYFNVLVKDVANNQVAYSNASQLTLAETTAPVVGTAISFANVAETSLTVNWGVATDNVTTQANLQYKVVKASSSAAIDTVGEADAIASGADLLMDWTANTLTKAVTGLTNGTTYYFAVLVKDEAGNKALYTPAAQATIDTATPIVGTAISFANVAGTSLTVNWGVATDNVTTQANLQYKVVKALSSAAIDSTGEADAITSGADLLMDWTANTLTKAVTGLTSSTTYYFAVLVKDAAGNTSLYAPVAQATADVTAPLVSTGILTPSSVTESQVILSWTKATDNVTTEANLQYLAYKATSSTLDSVLDIETNGVAVGTWAADIATKTVSLDQAGTTYYFNVIVKDEVGNKSAYTKLAQATADTTNPTISIATITPSSIITGGVTLGWTKATDNVSSQANLQYLAYYSDLATLNSVLEIETNGTPIDSYETDVASKVVSGLTPANQYYFNVIVKDGAGNKAAYSKVLVSFDPETITTIDSDNSEVSGNVTWGNPTSGLTLTVDGLVTNVGELLLDITDLDQIVASGATRFIAVEAGGSIQVKNRKKYTVRPKTKYRLKIKV